jgi:hypothetical protein
MPTAFYGTGDLLQKAAGFYSKADGFGCYADGCSGPAC